VLQSGGVIPTPLPFDRRQIRSISDTEVVEGTEELLLERLPQPQLGGDMATEPSADVLAIGPLRRGCKP